MAISMKKGITARPTSITELSREPANRWHFYYLSFNGKSKNWSIFLLLLGLKCLNC